MATLTDNFDSYSTGDLNGQGGWSGSTNWDVATDQVQTSPNSAKASATGNIDKSIDATGDGSQIFYARVGTVNAGQTNHGVQFLEGGTVRFTLAFNEGGGGTIYIQAAAETSIQSFSVNTWYKCEVQWQTSDNTVRARVDDGTWTSWVGASAAFTSIDSVRLRNADGTGSAFWIDSLSDPNVGGGTNYLTLLGAGK